MRKLIKKGILIILVAIMVIGSIPVSTSATELDSVKKQKEELEQKKKEIDNQIAELEKEKGDILNYIEKLDTQLNELTEKMNALTIDIEEAEANLEIAKEELEEARVREQEQYECMKRRIKYIYENGEPSFLDILSESKNISEFLNQVEIRSKITKYDNDVLDEYIEATEVVLEKEQVLEVKVDELKVMEEELEYEQDAVMILVEEKNKELTNHEDQLAAAEIVSNEYNDELEEKLAEIQHLEEEERKKAEEELKRKQEEERKQREAEELAKIAKQRAQEEEKRKEEEKKAAKSTTSNSSQSDSSGSNNVSSESVAGSSGYAWPVPSSRRITSYFGPRERPTVGASTYHRGIDIGASHGSDIVAIDSGKVTRVAYDSISGNYVEVTHSDGRVSQYLHCSSILVNVGANVSKGQTIAKIGSTGASTGPHLHFGLIVNGNKVDPLKYY